MSAERGRDRPESDFQRLRRIASEHGWEVLYFDHGIGHDSHLFLHNERGLAVGVFYRSSTAREAELNTAPIPVERAEAILKGEQ